MNTPLSTLDFAVIAIYFAVILGVGLSVGRFVGVARHFGPRIAFIHVREVEGDRSDFTELFHGQGSTDPSTLMHAKAAVRPVTTMRSR